MRRVDGLVAALCLENAARPSGVLAAEELTVVVERQPVLSVEAPAGEARRQGGRVLSEVARRRRRPMSGLLQVRGNSPVDAEGARKGV